MEITLRAPEHSPPPSARPPLLGVTPDEVAALHDELLAYHREFAPLFRRAEQRPWALKYLEGQLLPLERKSIEPMADALDGVNVQAMQQFISLGAWDDDAVLARHQQLVDRRLYIHEDWFTAAYAVRRTRCGVPTDLAFQTRTELTWAMIAELRERG